MLAQIFLTHDVVYTEKDSMLSRGRQTDGSVQWWAHFAMKSNCLESVTGYWLKLGYNKMHNWCAAFSAVAELLWNDVQSASRDSLLSSSTRTSTWRIYSLLSSDAIWLSWRSDNSMQKMLFSGLFKLYSWQTFISCFIIHQHIATEDLLKWPFSPTPALMHMQPPHHIATILSTLQWAKQIL